ncbi:hypothetical protein [Magnetospirillum sp. SS-4]|uniref:hypothetical protein n=1 Tax=Magnetospirillum sp. SS-4 TaxID=2681465 RepID=UPI00138131C9|nr:hypothetical protein [Magnetospirillum sp. SS-4]CAA7620720.1 conserved hypothetical protein [Magnetospirillum sp. SS-4]
MTETSRHASDDHWLVRPATVRRLWIGGIALLAGLVAAGTAVHGHAYFGVDGLFAFNAWYGFGACAAMVVAAKVLGVLLKRKDTYYDH